jgi:hypothetical protein
MQAHTPRPNRKAERVNETLLRKLTYRRAYPSSAWGRRPPRPRLRSHNERRPLTALDYRVPIARLPQQLSA